VLVAGVTGSRWWGRRHLTLLWLAHLALLQFSCVLVLLLLSLLAARLLLLVYSVVLLLWTAAAAGALLLAARALAII
jgi:hypothetical protein